MIDEVPDMRLYRLHGRSSQVFFAYGYVFAGYSDRVRDGLREETASGASHLASIPSSSGSQSKTTLTRGWLTVFRPP